MLPLEGKKILSFETWGAGAFHAELLALMGAEVINVEDPQQRGNPLRRMGSLYLDEEKQDNEGNQFCLHNKKSLALDIRLPEGQKVLHRLVAVSDAVINNFRGTLPEKLGITYRQLKNYNEKVVCTHLSAYGRDNERAGWPGYDFLMQAETGWMSVTGEPDSIPTKVGVSVVDLLGSVYAALCTLAALYRAEKTGKGGDADTNLFDIALNCTCYQGLWFLNDGFVAGKQPRSAHTTEAPSQLYKTADGWIYLACLSQKFWELLSDRISHPELKDDERFSINDRRLEHRQELTEVLDRIFSQEPTAHWLHLLSGAIPCAPVADIRQAFENPFVQNSGKIITLPYEKSPERRQVQFIAPPFSFDGNKFTDFKIGPKLGEHTEEIMKSLGYDRNEIQKLKEKRIIIGQ
ncbi:MAG: CoA transferase [Deltaproteobacteria bacterium]|nr:MAG: CoA transferase [Deltaproteobacteria bacterium]